MFRKLLTAVTALVLGATFLVATPAHAKPVMPGSGEGWISITGRTCGSTASWKDQARHNGSTAASGWLLPFRKVDIDCPKPSANAPRPPTKSKSKMATVIAYAYAQIGDPYRWGAAGPHAFDCSGLVVAAYKRIGIHLPHYTGSLLQRGHRVSRSQMRPGDLVFPSRGHVGIYIGKNKMIVAPHRGARVRIQTVYAFYTARRI